MHKLARHLPAVLCVLTLLGVAASAQTPERRAVGAAPQAQEQSPGQPDGMVNEIALLRKSLEALNTRLREISERLFAQDAQASPSQGGKQSSLAQHLALLTSTEQRAETMRRQLLELTEKETAFRIRLTQLDEEMRPESIDRNLALVGTTRTAELRDNRRRVLDNERRGVELLLGQTAQSRQRLEEDVKQADVLVHRLRQRLLPLIEREIDKISPN